MVLCLWRKMDTLNLRSDLGSKNDILLTHARFCDTLLLTRLFCSNAQPNVQKKADIFSRCSRGRGKMRNQVVQNKQRILWWHFNELWLNTFNIQEPHSWPEVGCSKSPSRNKVRWYLHRPPLWRTWKPPSVGKRLLSHKYAAFGPNILHASLGQI